MSTLRTTNLQHASSSSNNIVLDSSGHVTITNDLKINSGYGSATTVYGVRAWARINGTGTISEYGKAGFSSITDQSTGVYRFNFTNTMPDTNYAVAGSTDTNTVFQVSSTFNTGYIDTSIQNQSGSTADSDDVSVIVVR